MKKLLLTLLAVALVVSFSTMAFASGTDGAPITVTAEVHAAADIYVEGNLDLGIYHADEGSTGGVGIVNVQATLGASYTVTCAPGGTVYNLADQSPLNYVVDGIVPPGAIGAGMGPMNLHEVHAHAPSGQWDATVGSYEGTLQVDVNF